MDGRNELIDALFKTLELDFDIARSIGFAHGKTIVPCCRAGQSAFRLKAGGFAAGVYHGCGRRRDCPTIRIFSTVWRRVPVANSRDYAQIEQQLQDLHAMTEAAEAHGTLAGSLCAASRYRIEDWIGEILPDEVAGQAPSQTLRMLFTDTSSALAGQNMEFELLLPDD